MARHAAGAGAPSPRPRTGATRVPGRIWAVTGTRTARAARTSVDGTAAPERRSCPEPCDHRSCPEPCADAPTRTLRAVVARLPGDPAADARPVARGPGRRSLTGVARSAVRGIGATVLLAAVALAVAVAVVPVVAGGTGLTVQSPSMVPTFRPGDLVVIRPRPPEEIRVGDVIAFTDRDPASGAARTVTHRVVGVDPGPAFRTKGDANTDPDPDAVAAPDVRGVHWYTVPEVGGWGTAVRTGPGLTVACGAALLVVAAMVLVPSRARR